MPYKNKEDMKRWQKENRDKCNKNNKKYWENLDDFHKKKKVFTNPIPILSLYWRTQISPLSCMKRGIFFSKQCSSFQRWTLKSRK